MLVGVAFDEVAGALLVACFVEQWPEKLHAAVGQKVLCAQQGGECVQVFGLYFAAVVGV